MHGWNVSTGPCTGLGEHQRTEQGHHCSQLCPNPLVAEPHPSCSSSTEAGRVILNLLSKIHSTAPFIISSSFFFFFPPLRGFIFSLVGSRQSDGALHLPRKASSSSEPLFGFFSFFVITGSHGADSIWDGVVPRPVW